MDPPAAPETRDPLRSEEAEELVDELAFAERTESEIRGALGRAELGDALGEEKFTEVMTRARAARERVPRPLGKVLPRVGSLNLFADINGGRLVARADSTSTGRSANAWGIIQLRLRPRHRSEWWRCC
jgi:hypothetical protein